MVKSRSFVDTFYFFLTTFKANKKRVKNIIYCYSKNRRKPQFANVFFPEPCANNRYRCDGGNKCIPLKWICDGVHDCDDKLDERNCFIGNTTTIPSYSKLNTP